jgi:glutathione peroxidase
MKVMWLNGLMFSLMLLTGGWVMNTSYAEPACPAVLQHTFTSLQDQSAQNLCQYSGKLVLVVNSASKCGFTKQYDGLEALYAKYRDRGLVVLGFPSNDFGAQEPGSDAEIAQFCRLTYGVSFPMFSKSHVVGPHANSLFRQLHRLTGEAPKWNFHKYLIGRDGKVTSYPSDLTPEQLDADIAAAL